MQILSFKPGHDGSVALVADGRLEFSLESEKDSFPRYAEISPQVVLDALSLCDSIPDVICISGWIKGFHSVDRPLAAGYFGWSDNGCRSEEIKLLGKRTHFFSSTHERSHLWSSYAMSPFPQGQPCYALVWEGNLGSFYEMTAQGEVRLVTKVLEDPGNKYQFIFALADPTTSAENGGFRFSNAGKLMALVGYGRNNEITSDERDLIEFVLSRRSILLTTPKEDLTWSKFHDIGLDSPEFHDLAAKHSQAIFERFSEVAKAQLTKGYPLLISGGCGLNCSWNTQWRESGLFEAVFVPPVTNDSGSAIGTAADALHYYTGSAKLDWSVYAGPEFDDDARVPDEFEQHDADRTHIARLLAAGNVLALVQGRCEIGPRALGNRSLLAAPFDASMRDRLNRIKKREHYRPIAPVCREEDVAEYFEWHGESSFMLYFQHVRDSRLAAVTHADGTARVQTVRADENDFLYALLGEFRSVTGRGVLCNTSLNFAGRGFINRTSDLIQYVREQDIDGFVLGERLYTKRKGQCES